MGLDEYSPQEKAACWFAKEEYSTIRQKSIRIVKHMIHGKAEGLCTRGLERMAPNAAAARDARKERAYDAVLDEQDLQHITKEINPERIAHLYREAGSKEAHLHAVQMGLLDSVMATKIHSL